MLECMQSTSVRIDKKTHKELKRLSEDLGTTVGETVAIAVRRLRQREIGKQLATDPTAEDSEWLDADFG